MNGRLNLLGTFSKWTKNGKMKESNAKEKYMPL